MLTGCYTNKEKSAIYLRVSFVIFGKSLSGPQISSLVDHYHKCVLEWCTSRLVGSSNPPEDRASLG